MQQQLRRLLHPGGGLSLRQSPYRHDLSPYWTDMSLNRPGKLPYRPDGLPHRCAIMRGYRVIVGQQQQDMVEAYACAPVHAYSLEHLIDIRQEDGNFEIKRI